MGILRSAVIASVVLLSFAVNIARRDTRRFPLWQRRQQQSALSVISCRPDTTAAQAYPLILFLHGAGERGGDNEAQLNNNANGAMRLLDDANLALQPVFMIAPQCPTDGWWSGGTLTSAIGLVDQLSATYNIDPDRIYITGLSMGGMGTWSAVTAQPDRFAAAIPMSGNGDTNPAGRGQRDSFLVLPCRRTTARSAWKDRTISSPRCATPAAM